MYASYQPQFVREFVLDNIDPDRSSAEYVKSADMQSIARQYQGVLRSE